MLVRAGRFLQLALRVAIQVLGVCALEDWVVSINDNDRFELSNKKC